MKVGDLVRHIITRDVGVITEVYSLGEECLVYWPRHGKCYEFYGVLEVIDGKERQEKKEGKGKKGSVACGVLSWRSCMVLLPLWESPLQVCGGRGSYTCDENKGL